MLLSLGMFVVAVAKGVRSCMGLLLRTSVVQLVISGFCNCCCDGAKDHTYPRPLSDLCQKPLVASHSIPATLLLQPLHVTVLMQL